MSRIVRPFSTFYDFSVKKLEPKGRIVSRRLSHMQDMYHDQVAVKAMLDDDPVIYEVYNVDVPENIEQIQHCITVLYPGKVGSEYFMTKGHYHKTINRAEIYFGLEGEGQLVMQTKKGNFECLEMEKGTIAYVPPRWAHRTVNTGDGPFVFFAAYPGDAGHDYGEIEQEGFVKRVIEQNGNPTIQENPRFSR